MTWHILCLRSSEDTFRPTIGRADQILEVPFGIAGHEQIVQSSVGSIFEQYGLTLSESAEALLVAAISAYAVDASIPRRYAYDRWTRDFKLHLPVSCPAQWQQARPALEHLLSFLTGDHWTILLRPLAASTFLAPTQKSLWATLPLRAERVCLYSGGLDSFIGALDQLADGEPVVLVGHHGSGQGPTSIAQGRAIVALRQQYDANTAPYLRFWVSPPRLAIGVSEITTRGRSILFLALGIAVADAVKATQLIVPENGFISLNVPLTPSRLGSFSTRSTHPYLIDLFREVLFALDIHVKLVLPYCFQTKGEMLQGCADQVTLRTNIAETMSCAHPGAGRFSGTKDTYQHCGYCLPCLVRRASIDSFMVDPTVYRVEDLCMPLTPTRRSDLRACKLALDRYCVQAPQLKDILMSGPLHGSQDELFAYLDLYRRGLAELERFLTRVA
ncbi:MAG: Qat anti-phage system QueC-like protein QatC [Ktedonobacteraceae bacterium]